MVASSQSDQRDLDPIHSVDVTCASFGLPSPIRIGSTVITEREFAFVRITTSEGIEGSAFVLARAQPFVEVIERDLALLLIGRDSDAIASRIEDCQLGAVAPARPGLRTRAVSLVEIALWDIKARRAGLPLWRLLGGYRPDHPGLIVAEYLTDDSQLTAWAERIRGYGEAGFRLVKIKRGDTAEQTRALLESARAVLPADCEIVVDAAWSWRNVADARRELRAWGDVELAWLEDPFSPGDVRAAAHLRSAGLLRIGIGDEVADPHLLERLIEAHAIDVLRVDATTLGGIHAFRHAASLAIAAGLEVSTHAYPEVHVHCAAAWPGVSAVETFEAQSASFPSYLFVAGGPVIKDGLVHAPATPGLGVDLDWERIGAHATREAHIT